MMLKNHSDTEILLTCSTSPSAEGPDFVENERRYADKFGVSCSMLFCNIHFRSFPVCNAVLVCCNLISPSRCPSPTHNVG